MEKKILILGLILGMLSIIFGAFGAHALKKVLSEESLVSFETGVRYQMYHALFLLLIANTAFLSVKEKSILFYLVLVGVLFFSGSIYLLATSVVTGIKTKILGPITPIGGAILIASWGYFLYALIVKNRN
ncbi:DUF423 domain-containing protein [Flavobacterium tibetense]|jgi:uncharacterized membrane protein YgdD (TMEM256/DUF423 family)|uniref:DUF423 domain-containing protein n=1 Tax=Flavobacterium tibetense TaxID=2233533 RepID=A0A365P5N8_9FLAO|nr:DUF423 domain-containing protein [Flavobacterium tibetense]RBA29910.1 DUF423 domain-containing protein [Flavobacterium tibetense]